MAKFDVYNVEKKIVSSIEVSDAVFGADVNEHLFYEVVKNQLASRRSGTHAVKNRSLVSGGGKKPYKQKGTGNARQGSIRASHWVGGGKAMGPKPRDYSYNLPKTVRKGALCSALSLRAKEQKLLILDSFQMSDFKTKKALETLAKLGMSNVLVVDEKSNEKLSKSLHNLNDVTFLPPEGVNVYDLLKHHAVVLTVATVKALEARLS